MQNFFDRLDSGAYNVPLLIAFVLLFIAATLWSRTTRSVATAPFDKLEAQLAFQLAQREAQKVFEDPTLGPRSNEYFFKVAEALDRWEEWQGRPLSTLRDVGCDPSEAEWQALQLRNSIPVDESPEHVM